MAARLFQQIIEDVIGSSDEGDTFLSYYSDDDDYTEDDRRRRRRRRSGSGGRSSSHRRRRRNGGSRRHRSRDYARDDDGDDDDRRNRRNAGRSRSRRTRDDDEGEPSLSSSEGDGGSDSWTSATSGTGLSSSVYDRHRRRNHRSQSRSGRDRDRDRERHRRRQQEERRAAEEAAAAAAEAEAEAEQQRQRQRERRLERELQQREQERLEREREWREHAARAQKQQEHHHHHNRQDQQRYQRTASTAEEEETAGSLTRAVEDGIERSRHHQHQHQHQPPPRGDHYRNAELDRQRQKKERQESIERLIQEQGGELLVVRKHGADISGGNPYGDHRQQRDEEVSCLTTPTALEGMAGGVGTYNTGTAKAQHRMTTNTMQSIAEEDHHLHQNAYHKRRPSGGGDGGNGTGKHPWPCDPTAADYSPHANGVRNQMNHRDAGVNASRGINVRSASVDEYDAASRKVPQRSMMTSQSFDVGDTSTAARRLGGTSTAPSSFQPGVRSARSLDHGSPTTTGDGVGAAALRGSQHQLPPKPPKQLPRPYDQLQEEQQGSNQQQMIIEEAQHILSPYYQKRDTMPPPPPPPPPPTSGAPHSQSRPPSVESRPPVSHGEYLHRTNPLSPIKHKVQPLTSSMPSGLPLHGQVQPVQIVPGPSSNQPNHQDHNKSPTIPVTPNGPTPDKSAALVSPDISTGDADAVTAAAAIDVSESPNTNRRRENAEAAAAAAAALKAIKRQARSGRAKSASNERLIRKTLSIDWTRNLWSPCEEEEEDAEPSVFASPNYVPYWHCHIGDAVETTSSRNMEYVLHEMIPLYDHEQDDKRIGSCAGRDTATSSYDTENLVKKSFSTHTTSHDASPVTIEDTSSSLPLPQIVGTDVESTQCQSPPDSPEESLDESVAPPDPSMIGALDVPGIGDEHQPRNIAPDPPSGLDPMAGSTQKVLLDPPTDTSFGLLSDMSMGRIEVRPLEPLEQEQTPAAHEGNRCNDEEEGVEVIRKMTSDSDCLRAISLSTLPPADDDISDDEEPGKIRSVPSMASETFLVATSHTVVNVSDDEGSSPGKIRAVPSVDPDAREITEEEEPGYIRAVPSLDPDEDLSALAQRHILTVDTSASLDIEEAPEDAILAFRETMESDDESYIGGIVEQTAEAAREKSSTCHVATDDILSAEDAAVTQIQKLARGVQTRHRILAQMGVAKRRKWEPRTKTQDQTRIHSDIRRAARSYLRHRALVLDIPGPGSMALAVRRVCAIKIQRWFLNQAAFYRKMWTSITGFQALARGFLQRNRYKKLLENQSRQFFSSVKEVKKRPLDAFTAVIRIQAWVRSTIIRRAYVHEHRLRASYADVQWDKKKEGARNRIVALVPTPDDYELKTDARHRNFQDNPDEVKETTSHNSRAQNQSTPYKSRTTSADPSPISMATAALTDLERTLEEAREARDLSRLSAPYVSDAQDSSYENSYVSPHRLFDSESPDRLEIHSSSSPGTGTSSIAIGRSYDEDGEWTKPGSLPNEWRPKRFDTHSTMLSNDGQGQIAQDESAASNAETSSLLAAARSSRLKRMKGKLSNSRFGTSNTNDDNIVAQQKGQSTTRHENGHRMKHAVGAGDATSVTRQQYDDPPLSMPMDSFDEEYDAESRQFHVTIDSNENPFLNTSDVSALTNDIPMRRPMPTRQDFVTDNDTNFLGSNPNIERNDATMEEFF